MRLQQRASHFVLWRRDAPRPVPLLAANSRPSFPFIHLTSLQKDTHDTQRQSRAQWPPNSLFLRRSSQLTRTAVVSSASRVESARGAYHHFSLARNADHAFNFQMKSRPSFSTQAIAIHALASRARMSPNVSCPPSTAISATAIFLATR